MRATRDAFFAFDPNPGYTPLDWVEPDTQQEVFYRMLLRDELPAVVQAALERPSF